MEFNSRSSFVAICEFCQCVVARGDRGVEDHGKVSDLVVTNTPLFRGATGKLANKNFEVTGRVQYQHPAGGVWDEWYLLFSNGKWGWLAEAEGRFFLTFEKRIPSSVEIPDFESLEPGTRFKLGSKGDVAVREVTTAISNGAEGEIPWAFRVGAPHRFADLEGQNNEFGTVEYADDGLKLFLGREVTLDDLKIDAGGWGAGAPGSDEIRVKALSVSCPNCAGPLELHAPDETQRVCCPSCSSLLDCESGNLSYLKTLKTRRVKPVIPLGTVGKLNDVEYTIIGFMERFARYQGVDYPWTEYLLKSSKGGFRWLVRTNKHWSFVKPVSVGAITEGARTARYDHTSFRLYDSGKATVRYVLGEFFWRVEVGEETKTADYIAPPRMVSVERSMGDQKEMNVSVGEYLTVEEVEEAFGVKDLARSWKVGTLQPAPVISGVMVSWAAFAVLMVLLKTIFSVVLTDGVDFGFFLIMLVLMSVFPIGVLIHRYSFEVSRWQDSDYSPYSTE